MATAEGARRSGMFGLPAVVADESELLRLGVASVLARLRVRLAGEVGRGGDVIACVRHVDAELLILGKVDADLVALVERVKQLPTAPRVVILLPATARHDLARLVQAGVDALLTRLASADELRRAVVEVEAGGRYVAAAPLAAMLGELPAAAPAGESTHDPTHALTRRELEVLRYVAAGRSNQEIADALFVSVPTVKTHLAHIYDKFDVDRRAQAVGRALELGLLS